MATAILENQTHPLEKHSKVVTLLLANTIGLLAKGSATSKFTMNCDYVTIFPGCIPHPW